MSPEELKLEILKLATRKEMCGDNDARAVAIAERFWRFLIGTETTRQDALSDTERS